MHEGLDGGERTLAQRATMRNVSYVFGRSCSERSRKSVRGFRTGAVGDARVADAYLSEIAHPARDLLFARLEFERLLHEVEAVVALNGLGQVISGLPVPGFFGQLSSHTSVG